MIKIPYWQILEHWVKTLEILKVECDFHGKKNYRQPLIEVLQAALDAVQSLQQVLLAQEEVLRFACDTRCLYARNHPTGPTERTPKT